MSDSTFSANGTSSASSSEPIRRTGRSGSMSTAEIKARLAVMFGDADEASSSAEGGDSR
ncbi:hypothetical protein [Rhodococcus sp. (in: high G+C Gram-positive bacteria)]|uniref:hypothetical protein n=1 Tax=Rhodococcus sp. TaxID=1831 RepID=UPI003890FB76